MPRGQQQEHIPIPIDGIEHTTAAAILIKYYDHTQGKYRPVWVPRSQVYEGDAVVKDPDAKELNISPWFCKKEGLA